MVAAVNCFSSASLYWACHARVASEQEEVMERYAVDCQAGAFESKFGDGKETSGGSHDDLISGRRNRPWVRKFLPSPGVAH